MSVCTFKNGDDYTQGGQVNGDFGEKPCQWELNVETQMITVTGPTFSRSQNIPGRKLSDLDPDEAKERTAEVARSVYDDLLANPPING